MWLLLRLSLTIAAIGSFMLIDNLVRTRVRRRKEREKLLAPVRPLLDLLLRRPLLIRVRVRLERFLQLRLRLAGLMPLLLNLRRSARL
ncbi:hypothetical protein PENNAL_c0650G06267 [Penicillium nalgiovense]|uniref:Uncharacterized protein n=1 Tax=Penicillium nalgiovense TaxID=60175 RepID=A0A1V6V426_PENNA|nr:hypothetical protein PENNAL_c0650G06267 [Penicillium nalgiovense]